MKDRKFFGFGRNVFVSELVSFFMDVSSEMIYPLVPLFLSNVIGVNKSVIGLIEGIAESTASLLKVFSGWFSDRHGNRKWLMAVGYGISTLSRPIVALATSWHHIIGARFIDRFGKGIRYYGFALASDTKAVWILFGFYGLFMGLTEGIQKAFLATIIPHDFKATTFGIYNTIIGIALFPASMIGGILWDRYGPHATFYYGSATAFLSAVLFIIFIIAVKKKGHV